MRICEYAKCDNNIDHMLPYRRFCGKSCAAKVTQSWTFKKDSKEPVPCVICKTLHKRNNSPYCTTDCSRTSREWVLNLLLVDNSPDTIKTASVKVQLVKYGYLTAKCNECGLTEWRGKEGLAGPLQLDHINGKNNDNRLENLRILCANCHALTDTYCGRNIKNNYKLRS